MAQPNVNVVVTMGDGGQGIGGAHLLAAGRRNLDLTLLILNNFNFGMTGGQFSATTPAAAQVGSGFLNQLEQPLVEGFAVIDTWGVCPGRYTKKNRLTPKLIEEQLAKLPSQHGSAAENARPEYGRQYRELSATLQSTPPPVTIKAEFQPPQPGRREVILLGSAGQRIITAGEILCLAGLYAGQHTTQKNEYNITVLRGPSISELILSPQEIDFTGIEHPSIVVALSQEGIDRRKDLFGNLDNTTTIIKVNDVKIPSTSARIHDLDLKALGVKKPDWALAALAEMAKMKFVINFDMLKSALNVKLSGNALQKSLALVEQIVVEPMA
jgi:Pyruvate/2-oxoacid:ferredoxin oxidoreductase gamma subunit